MEWCLYASKPCWNLRCIKNNGELHRFCLYHRAKANASQRRWQSRRQPREANSEENIHSDEQGQASPAPVKMRKSDEPIPTKEMRLLRQRMLRHQYRVRTANLPPPQPEIWSRPVHADHAETAHARIKSADGNELGQLLGTEDIELMQSLSDEEISLLLENIVDVTVDPLSGLLVPNP